MDLGMLLLQLLLWSPSIVSGVCLAVSCHREPRQFRNAIYLLVFVIWTSMLLLMRFGQQWMVVPILAVVALAPVVTVVALVANGVVVVRRNGLSAASLLPIAMAVLLVLLFFLTGFVAMLGAPAWVTSLAALFDMEALWFCFSCVALLLYSWLYRRLPRRRTYDYIVIHGAGLVGREPSPLLAGRIDKALELWERQGRAGTFVPSGGQGPDEEVSEAEAMAGYLLRHGVPEGRILREDRSTTTMENLLCSKRLMDERSAGRPYRCAVVTSDFHVFRCAEYAHQVGLAADGVGSKTRGWLWPASFIREFVAVSRAHKGPYVAIAVVWVVPTLLSLLG